MCDKGDGGRQSLLQQLARQGHVLASSCGGGGTCGKCRVCVTKGSLPVTAEDRKFFKGEELDNGYRLACQAFPEGDVEVLCLDPSTDAFTIVSNYESTATPPLHADVTGFSINIDLGTTTIAMNLTQLPTLEERASFTTLNPCLPFGSDVVSRIHASNTGKRDEMRELLSASLQRGITALLSSSKLSQDQITGVVIAANATMIHNLMGYSCMGMSRYPFSLDYLGFLDTDSTRLWGDPFQTKVTVLPFLSAFIGADVVSGLYHCRFPENEDLAFFLDLGTNGEMAVGNKDSLLCTSVAAGPAFEGGNLSCGTGSVAGAIYDVDIAPPKGTLPLVNLKTIQNEPPIGLCGTGSVSLLYELLKGGYMNQTGLLADAYFNDGFPLVTKKGRSPLSFTQADVREMQLAIGAIRAGMDTLIKRYGVSWGQIGSFYLAGGFGYHVNLKKAIAIGLLPKELKSQIQVVGNTSLGGACEYLASPNARSQWQDFLSVIDEISLGNDKYFQAKFVSSMAFPS